MVIEIKNPVRPHFTSCNKHSPISYFYSTYLVPLYCRCDERPVCSLSALCSLPRWSLPHPENTYWVYLYRYHLGNDGRSITISAVGWGLPWVLGWLHPRLLAQNECRDMYPNTSTSDKLVMCKLQGQTNWFYVHGISGLIYWMQQQKKEWSRSEVRLVT